MIEVKITNENYDEFGEKLYDFDGEYIADEDCSSWAVVEMFAQAMRTAGYIENNILQSMYDYAIEHAEVNAIKLYKEEDENVEKN